MGQGSEWAPFGPLYGSAEWPRWGLAHLCLLVAGPTCQGLSGTYLGTQEIRPNPPLGDSGPSLLPGAGPTRHSCWLLVLSSFQVSFASFVHSCIQTLMDMWN